MFIQHSNTDFRVVVCAPSVEYHISAKNFTFVKALTRKEVRGLIERKFANWDQECLNLALSVKKFQEVYPGN